MQSPPSCCDTRQPAIDIGRSETETLRRLSLVTPCSSNARGLTLHQNNRTTICPPNHLEASLESSFRAYWHRPQNLPLSVNPTGKEPYHAAFHQNPLPTVPHPRKTPIDKKKEASDQVRMAIYAQPHLETPGPTIPILLNHITIPRATNPAVEQQLCPATNPCREIKATMPAACMHANSTVAI